jgi:hypothetical protein
MWYATLSEHNTCGGACVASARPAYRWRYRPQVAEALGASASDTATRVRYSRGQEAPAVRRPQVRGILGVPSEAYHLITHSIPLAL